MFSPGQFRLGWCRRSDRDGVRPSGHRARCRRQHADHLGSFLAPRGVDDLAVEFADPDAADVLALNLG